MKIKIFLTNFLTKLKNMPVYVKIFLIGFILLGIAGLITEC